MPDTAQAAAGPDPGQRPDLGQRLITLDLIRGIAVLGILTVNIAGFAGPMIGSTTPNLPHPVGPADEAAWAFTFVLFEGKMRALFSLLFGAGIMLFWERTEAAGRDGNIVQFRRLCWLLLLGALHYLLLWWGDILFVYAACGVAALLLRPLHNLWLIAIAMALYYGWHLWGLLDMADIISSETALRRGVANAQQLATVLDWMKPVQAWTEQEMTESHYGYWRLVLVKLVERPFWQVQMLGGVFSETLPLMLLGIVCYRRGLFDGPLSDKRVSDRRLRELGVVCTTGGLALTLAFLGWAWPRHFPPIAMHAAMLWGLSVPHLMMGTGYAALLALGAPRIARTRIGQRLIAAGRTAFSNYILSSFVMTFVFYGWGLNHFGTVGPLAQWLFVLAGWTLMLVWSPLWLRHFRRGPVEWLWRSLVEGRPLANRING